MKYRKMGSLDWEVSVLGFGAMRLPIIDQTTVNEEEAINVNRFSHDARSHRCRHDWMRCFFTAVIFRSFFHRWFCPQPAEYGNLDNRRGKCHRSP